MVRLRVRVRVRFRVRVLDIPHFRLKHDRM